MQTDLHRRVLDTIALHAMMQPGGRIGLGVSGGADSVALLRILLDVREELGLTLFVLHFHHQLRGADADEDERFVRSLAEQFQLEFQAGRADVAAEAKLRGWNLEDAARRLRHEFFAAAAAKRSLDRVAVAHTLDDQAETVLSHLLRGTGITGLAGIYPIAGTIVRPLIEIGREELRAYLSTLGQAWREDATNQDTSRTRARIRHGLIPVLLRDFDGGVVKRLARLASHAREEEEFWRLLEDERFRALTTRDPSGMVSLGIGDLLAPLPSLSSEGATSGDPSAPRSPMALTRRLVRRIYAELRGTREQLTSQHVESVIGLATKCQSGAKVELPGVCVDRIFNQLRFVDASAPARRAHEFETAVCEFAYTVARPADAAGLSIAVPEIRRRFHLKRVDWPPAESETVSGRGALDYDRVQWPLVLRNWRPGDSYRPHGSRRVRKLKRLFLESRVPRNVRGSWPVLAGPSGVVWASGYPVAEDLAAGSGTQTGLLIDEEEL